MPTAQTIITQALIDLGIYSPGETPSATDSANGLAKLNIMLDNWSGARDLVYEIAVNSYLLGNSQSFPIGPTATPPFNVARPIKIETATVLITGSGGIAIRSPIQVITQEEWQSIPDRAATGTLPLKMYFDPSVPNAVLNFYPIPLATATTTLELGTWNVVQQFASLSTNAALPPAYYRGILLGLELELVPTYGNLINATIAQERAEQFKEAIAIMRDLNSRVQMVPLQSVTNPPPPQQQLTPQQLAAIQAKRGANA